ncbi:hypothetical protein ACPF8X_07405 [Streptomyces sp. G35A]
MKHRTFRITAGVTVYEALKAAEDTGCLPAVDDHREEGGPDDAVLDALTDGRRTRCRLRGC